LNIGFFFSKIDSWSTFEGLIHSIWTCYEKVMNNLVIRQFKHSIGKSTYRSHLRMQFSQLFIIFFWDKVNYVCKNNLIVGIIVLQFHLRAMNNLVFYSMLDLVTYFYWAMIWRMKMSCFFGIFFLQLWTQIFNTVNV